MQSHTSSGPCGIVRVLPDLSETYLPLEKAKVHASIFDGGYPVPFSMSRNLMPHVVVSAIVTIVQRFWQYSPDGLGRAKYVFPVPARAAICAFEMTAEDGTVITAVAKEKEEARREYEQAISQGSMTGLVEHVTDDSTSSRHCLWRYSAHCLQYFLSLSERFQDSS